jgi:hypothetical protein
MLAPFLAGEVKAIGPRKLFGSFPNYFLFFILTLLTWLLEFFTPCILCFMFKAILLREKKIVIW